MVWGRQRRKEQNAVVYQMPNSFVHLCSGEWGFCFVLRRGCNDFVLFRVLPFQGTLESNEFKGREMQVEVCRSGVPLGSGYVLLGCPFCGRECCSLLWVSGGPPDVVGQGAAMGGKFLGAGAEALAPDESYCYCCWKDKTRQLLGGIQNKNNHWTMSSKSTLSFGRIFLCGIS